MFSSLQADPQRVFLQFVGCEHKVDGSGGLVVFERVAGEWRAISYVRGAWGQECQVSPAGTKMICMFGDSNMGNPIKGVSLFDFGARLHTILVRATFNFHDACFSVGRELILEAATMRVRFLENDMPEVSLDYRFGEEPDDFLSWCGDLISGKLASAPPLPTDAGQITVRFSPGGPTFAQPVDPRVETLFDFGEEYPLTVIGISD